MTVGNLIFMALRLLSYALLSDGYALLFDGWTHHARGSAAAAAGRACVGAHVCEYESYLRGTLTRPQVSVGTHLLCVCRRCFYLPLVTYCCYSIKEQFTCSSFFLENRHVGGVFYIN